MTFEEFQRIQGRRDFLRKGAGGLGMIALARLLGAAQPKRTDPLAPKLPHFAPKAKSVIFLFMEGALDIIYHVRPRGIIGQNVMAFVMLLIFVLLVPIMLLASAGPALVFSILQKTPLAAIPGIQLLFSLGGILGGLLASYLLFQVIYIVVPNQKISFRHSWLGAVVAAVLLEIYLALFPLYAIYFLRGFGGALVLLILLIFFYYFALILFLGAEVNAFFAEGVRDTPYDLTTMVHLVTSHLATSEEGVKEQAAVDHKDEVPKEIHPKYDRSQASGDEGERLQR